MDCMRIALNEFTTVLLIEINALKMLLGMKSVPTSTLRDAFVTKMILENRLRRVARKGVVKEVNVISQVFCGTEWILLFGSTYEQLLFLKKSAMLV